jgi:ornithine cyclodeaminase/alanine dehydrogenase-like protein (mu-crystallin family)
MSKVFVLDEHAVTKLLTPAACIDVMADALAALANGEVYQPLRTAVRPPGAVGLFGLMPAYRSAPVPLFALKEVCVFPGNPARGLDTHLGAVLLHSGETGEVLGIFNAAAITAIRTAAVSALATKLLARAGAATLAIIGTGAQARAHLDSIPLVRPIAAIRVAGRSHERAAKFVEQQHPRAGIRIEASRSVEEAVRGADIVVTATSARDPIVRREWIAAGTHINAVGSSVATSRELDGVTVAACSLYVDRRESTINESGEYRTALAEGAITQEHIVGEIGEVLIGKARGRESEDEITLFKSLGLAVEDLASAAWLYEQASSLGVGNWVEL